MTPESDSNRQEGLFVAVITFWIHTLTEYLNQIKPHYPDRVIAVIIPELVEMCWWTCLMHNRRDTLLKANLLLLRDPWIVVINVPWYVHQADNTTGKSR